MERELIFKKFDLAQLSDGCRISRFVTKSKLSGLRPDSRPVCFGSKADIARCKVDVRFTPKADIGAKLLDHLVGER